MKTAGTNNRLSLIYLILLIFPTIISCGLTDTRSSTLSTDIDSENRDPSCSYFYFLWGTHEEYSQRYVEALDAYRKALVCDPLGTYIKQKLPILHLKMDNPGQAIKLLIDDLEKNPNDTNQRLLLARIYIQQKDEQKAIDQYQQIISYDPENVSALLRLGVLLTQTGDLQRAGGSFKKLLKLDPEAYFARLYLARIADQQDNITEAQKQYQAALDLNYSVDLAYEIGEFHLKYEQYEKTIDIMRKVLTQDDGEERARFAIVQALLALDREEEAVAELSVAKELSRSPEKISLILSRLYLRNGENEKARDNLEAILEVKDNSEARYLLGVLYMEKERWSEALELLAGIPPFAEEFEDAVTLQSRIYHQNNQTETALELLETHLAHEDTRREFFYILTASLYQESDQDEAAIEILSEGLIHFPDSEKLLFDYGLQLERTGRLEEAIDVMAEIIKRNPDHPEALNFIGYSWADTDRNLEQALEYIARAMELKPGNGYIQDSLGWVYFKLGDLIRAQKELSEALTLVPDDPHIYDHLGDVYMAMGKSSDALKAYQTALEYFVEPDKQTRVRRKIEKLTDQ